MSASRTPSGTAAPSVTRPSLCSIQPTGGRVVRWPCSARWRRRCERAEQRRGSPSSSTRQQFPRISVNRSRDRELSSVTASGMPSRTPVSRPASSSAAVESSRAWTPASAPSPDTSPRPSSRPNRNRPGQSREPGVLLHRGVQCGDESADVADPAAAPDSGEATMLRTRSWVGEGSSPAAASELGRGLGVTYRANLEVAARGQLDGRRPELGGGVGHRLQLSGGDHPARQPDAGQLAVGGLVSLQRAGTGVVVPFPGHPSTVPGVCERPEGGLSDACWRCTTDLGVEASTGSSPTVLEKAPCSAPWCRLPR